MDAIAFSSAPNPKPTPFSSSSAYPSSRPQRFSVCDPRRRRPLPALRSSQLAASTSASASHHDVVIVGAGIVGLSIARHLLRHTPLSVAVADAAVPCSGATGAGQGYIWMSHRTPESDTWELAVRSKQLWEELGAEMDGPGGGGARESMGWMRTGSLLVGRTSEELATLEERTKILSQAGIHAECLSASSLHSLEPALCVGNDGGAMLLPEDCQIDAFQAVSLIEKINSSYSPEGRYMELYNDPAMSLIRSEVTGTVEAVQTSKNILYGRKAIVIASGAWTRSLLHSFLEPNSTLDIPVKPRKGHLLVFEKFDKLKLNHGLMELGYADHEVAKSNSIPLSSESKEDEHGASSISMTATLNTKGNLVLGSSREFKGFSTEVDKSILKCIWERAGEFFPVLKNVHLDIGQNTEIRIGHRPYMPDGKPVIGFVPDLPNVLIATGHEGSGLALSLGTAEMVTDMILENPGRVDFTPFSIKDRFPDGVFQHSAYAAMFHGATRSRSWCLIWKSWALQKVKFFLWLACQNRCWTADRLASRGLPHHASCLLCGQSAETMQHLLVACNTCLLPALYRAKHGMKCSPEYDLRAGRRRQMTTLSSGGHIRLPRRR